MTKLDVTSLFNTRLASGCEQKLFTLYFSCGLVPSRWRSETRSRSNWESRQPLSYMPPNRFSLMQLNAKAIAEKNRQELTIYQNRLKRWKVEKSFKKSDWNEPIKKSQSFLTSATLLNFVGFQIFVVKPLFAFLSFIGPFTKRLAILCPQLTLWLVNFVRSGQV